MNYFIDFEATQYTHEIISIGCIREDNEVFKSLVWVKRKHMSNFITRLTGITKDDIQKAPSSDRVFEDFYYWIRNDRNPVFYCYGDADITFIQANLDRANNKYAIMALKKIRDNLKDYAIQVKEYFGIHKTISLKKLVAYYRQVDEVEQSHDALEDSLFLKEVYGHIITEEPDRNAFLEYRDENQSKKHPKVVSDLSGIKDEDRKYIGLVRYHEDGTRWPVGDLYRAVRRCMERIKRNRGEITDKKCVYGSIKSDILKAVKNGTKCCGFYWVIEENSKGE